MTYTARVITLNDDFTDRTSDIRAVFDDRRPLAVLTQESKREDLRKRLPDRLGVAQVLRNDGTAGVAVVWDRGLATALQEPKHRVLCHPRGAAMEPRGVTWQRVKVHGTPEPLILAAAHRPPSRYSHLWEEFDKNLDRWVRTRRVPVILGMDANTRRLAELADRLGMRQAGAGVDAVFVTHPLRIRRSRLLPRARSDHRAFEATVALP